jgi:hypothetical protein
MVGIPIDPGIGAKVEVVGDGTGNVVVGYVVVGYVDEGYVDEGYVDEG